MLLRIVVSPNGCTSPDSVFYLESAQNLSTGQGYFITFEGVKTFNAIWPMGYPLSIVLVHSTTGLNLFWASKVVNYLCLLLCWSYIQRRYGDKAWFVSLPFCTGTMIKIASYTWSETQFITLLLIWVLALYQLFLSPKKLYSAMLVVSGFGMFITRYIGGFSVLVTSLITIFFALKKERTKSLLFGLLTILEGLLMAGYLAYNYNQTGTWAGGGIRDALPNESFSEYGLMVLRGVFNEWWLVKDTDFQRPDPLFLIGVVVQLVVGWKAIQHRHTIQKLAGASMTLPAVLVITALSYAFFLMVARRNTAFMDLDFRYFAPMTLLLWLAFALWMIAPEQAVFFKKTYRLFTALFLLSVIDALIPTSISLADTLRLVQEKIF